MQLGKLIGLTGPSGIGKGFIKDQLRRAYPDLVELAVATTRPRRPTDGFDRDTDIPVAVFLERESSGEIIFAHQPFGPQGDWYGFYRDQLATLLAAQQNILTEVHVDNVKPFKQELGERAMIIGLVAQPEYLAHNLAGRNSESATERQQRLDYALRETSAIRQLHREGLINILIAVDHGVREQLAQLVAQTAEGFLRPPEINRPSAGKERQ